MTLSKQEISQLKQNLQQQQADIQSHFDQNDHFGLTRSDAHDAVGELSSYDNHPGDTATETYEREKDLALNEHAKQELHEIEEALQAIAHSTYGTCKVCGADISFERLQAVPTTLYCREHSPSQDIPKH